MSVNLLALLDDIAATMDDVAIMTKLAVKKTSALMSDDLAVNTNQLDGVKAENELPAVFKIFIGSLVNKVICIAGVLGLEAIYPFSIQILLALGAIYLAFEGFDKLLKKIIKQKTLKILHVDVNTKVWGAIKTDFILSIEIIVLAKSTMVNAPLLGTVISLSIVGLLASFLIYGLVAILVKIDDFGLWLVAKRKEAIGLFLVRLMPIMMKTLGHIGMIAMFLVAGGIVSHLFHIHLLKLEFIQNFFLGIILGGVIYFLLFLAKKVKSIIYT